MSESQEVLYDVKDKVATITINRPQRRNALTPNVMAGLNECFDRAGADPDVSAIILTGADGNFCSGADLGGGFGGDQSFLDIHYDRGHYADLLIKMNKCKKPILAAIEGYCLAGGMGLCLSSDVVIASEDAQFGVPEIKRGLWPYMVTAVLIRNVGRKKAAELCMTGDRIPAAEAERIGILLPDRRHGHGRRAELSTFATYRQYPGRGFDGGHSRIHGEARSRVERTLVSPISIEDQPQFFQEQMKYEQASRSQSAYVRSVLQKVVSRSADVR